ncbi:hypothetical protein ACWDTT_22020 [Streptosporangium sandarakinum]
MDVPGGQGAGVEVGVDQAFGAQVRLAPGAAAGLGPEERRRSFLCPARGETSAADAMFPEDLADQRVLAHGAQLCALPGDRERSALHERAGGTADAIELAAALDYLCPGIVAGRCGRTPGAGAAVPVQRGDPGGQGVHRAQLRAVLAARDALRAEAGRLATEITAQRELLVAREHELRQQRDDLRTLRADLRERLTTEPRQASAPSAEPAEPGHADPIA